MTSENSDERPMATKLPDLKTFDPNGSVPFPEDTEQVPELLEWKLDLLAIWLGKSKQCLDKVIDCLEQIKLLLIFILALLAALVIIALITLVLVGVITVLVALALFVLITLMVLAFFVIVQVVVPAIIARNRARNP